MVKRREWLLNSFTMIVIFMFAFASLIWPAPDLAADTTGVQPNYHEVLNSDDYLKDTIIIEFYSEADIKCLTENMYHEARSDGYAGMYATTMVVMNRVADWRYPDTVCEVVKQGPIKESWTTAQHDYLLQEERVYFPVINKCQFSWYCDGREDTMYDEESLHIAEKIAHLVLGVYDANSVVDITEGATHYHTTAVSPYWINGRGMAKITQIGSHIFYKWN
jgi:spore germination cell wall hydrolase CwlJ-like protein|tara:strand:- start:500 stop:1159 length:660 start_codon:yes stop_codon:yes gene_type:complete